MKRLLSSTASEVMNMTKKELLQSIKASSGRIILAENDVVIPPFAGNITNSEVVSAFGADLILLNCLDLNELSIIGLDYTDEPIKRLKELTGKPIGVNLEPVDSSAELESSLIGISNGRTASVANLIKAQELGFDFICLTGNPGTGVSNKEISNAIEDATKYFNGMIIAGKMHSAGVSEKIIDHKTIDSFVLAGADIILVPVAGTVPGFSEEEMREACFYIQKNGKLAMSAIGTTQEGADEGTIRSLALTSKRAGADIQHIGDAGFNGTADPENIMALSIAIRGKRHTYLKMAQSINR
ncbi:MAG: haloacid dehalogenase-like hydrolase [Vagococcus sp.]